jgi:hypothetical protein
MAPEVTEGFLMGTPMHDDPWSSAVLEPDVLQTEARPP